MSRDRFLVAGSAFWTAASAIREAIETCFDFPVAEALKVQPPRAIPALATGQPWRTPGGASITVGCAVDPRPGSERLQYLELDANGEGSWQRAEHIGSLASRSDAGLRPQTFLARLGAC